MDSYNPHAFVNSGVCEMMKEKFDAAKFMFTNALEIDATLFEAIYNMGEILLLKVESWHFLMLSTFSHHLIQIKKNQV